MWLKRANSFFFFFLESQMSNVITNLERIINFPDAVIAENRKRRRSGKSVRLEKGD